MYIDEVDRAFDANVKTLT